MTQLEKTEGERDAANKEANTHSTHSCTYLEMLLKLARVGLLNITVLVHAAMKTSIWRLIHVSKKKCLASRRPVVKTRATVPVPAYPDLEVKWTIHTILLRTENRRQMFRHCSILCYFHGIKQTPNNLVMMLGQTRQPVS
jgi:hypothetical protein